MANATKHELYKVELSFSVERDGFHSEAKTIRKEYGGKLLIMTKNDDVRHISDMVTSEFLNKPYRELSDTKILKVHITRLTKMKFQPSLGVIVEE